MLVIIMNEFGGYLEFENYNGKEYHPNAIALNSGRFCLEYIIRVKNIRKLYIPFFLCDSVKNICDKLYCETEFYSIDYSFRPNFNYNLLNGEYLYIVNYYNQIDDHDLLKYKSRYKNIIVDNVHAFFRYPLPGVDTIYSCRKFFGVPDGAYLYTQSPSLDNLEFDKSYLYMQHILGRYDENASKFYEYYLKAEHRFENETLKKMSLLTHNLLRSIDYDFVNSVRTSNYLYFYKRFKDINKLNVGLIEGAYMYPLYLDNGPDIRKELINMGIYISQLWPEVLKNTPCNSIEYKLAENILPIPCDQRYSKVELDSAFNIIMKAIS